MTDPVTNHHRSRGDFILFVVILGALTALGPLSIDMYLPAFTLIARELSVAPATVQFSLSVFLAGMAVGQLFYGSVSDRYGRKRPLYAGLTLFIAASAACALATDANHLIAARFFAAVGMCSGVVIARAMIRDLFDPAEAARVFSLLILVMGIAPILAPLAGGYVSTHAGWRAIFWILTAFGAILLVAVATRLPETRPANPTIRLADTFSIYKGILCEKTFLRYALPGTIAFGGMFAYVTGAPYAFIELFDIPVAYFGWFFGANALGFIAMSQINARLVRRYPPERLMRIGLYLAASFGAMLILAGVSAAGPWIICPLLFCYISTLGLTGPNSMSMALSSQPVFRAGSASALVGTLQFVFSSTASALLSAIHPESAFPMAAIVGICGILALSFYLLLSGRSLRTS